MSRPGLGPGKGKGSRDLALVSRPGQASEVAKRAPSARLPAQHAPKTWALCRRSGRCAVDLGAVHMHCAHELVVRHCTV